ncbi:MAG: T9SS type A sorting domain-containing protein [Bacteroidia bacterium]|nr:T9SS type A sorting domain-containing protein [Bacteroidia bacterium]
MHRRILFAAFPFLLFPQFFFAGDPPIAQDITPLCISPEAQVDLDIGNVRSRILNGGDMWWDLSNAGYEVPKGTGDHSLFAGTLWFGGIDASGQLHTACMTYRQGGNDFWPGPMDTVNVIAYDSLCEAYDYIWKVNRWEVEEFIVRRNESGYIIPNDIASWPGNGRTYRGEPNYLAPFTDVNGDGKYFAADGDYPGFDLSGNNICNKIPGDQCLWWIINDRGNSHEETNGLSLGIEIHCMAYAFQSSGEELANATFYQYKLINRSADEFNNFWWGQYADVDLGDYSDDFVGCDVKRGLGYAYNGDPADGNGGPGSYGNYPPAIGVDFLQGPLADAFDGLDNDQDSMLDEPGERFKMSRFVYYNGDWSSQGNPNNAINFYTYLQGVWMDGVPITYGGNGYNEPGPVCHYMFPGTSDPYGWGTGGVPMPSWTETTVGNTPSDRRFLMTMGPMTLEPGEVMESTIGVPWAQDSSGNNLTSVNKLQFASDIVQAAFDSCFIFPCTSPLAQLSEQHFGLTYMFAAFSNGDSFSWDFGDNSGSGQKFPTHIYTEEGRYTVCLTVTNSCGSSSTCLVIDVEEAGHLCGPELTRIEGKGNSGYGTDITEKTEQDILSSNDHRVLFPTYKGAKGPVRVIVKDFEHLVNGDYILKFDSVHTSSGWKMYRQGSLDTVFSDSVISIKTRQMISQWGLEVTVDHKPEPGDPGSVNLGFVEANMIFTDPGKKWLKGLADKDGQSDRNWIRSGFRNDQTNNVCMAQFDDYIGLDPGEIYETVMGGMWAPYRLTGSSQAVFSPFCYSGGPCWDKMFASMANLNKLSNVDLVITADKSKWTRCCVLETCDDPMVVEPHPTNTLMNARKLDLRTAQSVDKSGNTGDGWPTNDPSDADFISPTGMSWFPGYAIDLETGERLNIAFGENSWLAGHNGRDMLWNPTATEILQPGTVPVFGGMHYIYIFGHNSDDTNFIPRYDYGKKIRVLLNATAPNTPVNTVKRNVFRDAMWVNIPLLEPGRSIFETDVRIRLRVMKPFMAYPTTANPQNRNYPMYSFTINSDAYQDCYDYTGPTILYPNPFSDEALLEFENNESHPAHLKIYDVKGRLVRIYKSIRNDRIVIRRESLADGVYFYELHISGEKPQTGKFILTD